MNQPIKYELFQQQIINEEHKNYLHLLLNLDYGKSKFCKLLNDLIKELNSENIVDLECYKIKSCQTNFIEIINEKKDERKNEEKKEQNLEEKQYKPRIQIIKTKVISLERNSPQNSQEDKINNFFHALFDDGPLKNQYFKNNYKKMLGENIACHTQWINLFKQFWFYKKQYKVLHIKKQFESLILLPNSDIILTNTNHSQNILLTNTSKLFYNQNQSNQNPDNGIYPDFSKFKIYMHELCFIGNLDPISFLPSNQGIYHCTNLVDQNQAGYIKPAENNTEPFILGLPQNQYIIDLPEKDKGQYNFQNGLLQDNQSHFKQKYIAYSQISTVSLQFMKGLLSGGWVLQTILDFLVEELYETYRLVKQSKKEQNQSKTEKEIFILDSRQMQDVFSSQIGKNNSVNHEAIKENKVLQHIQQYTGDYRVIYLIIVDQSHFICAAYEKQNDTVYILNSMSFNDSDNGIAEIMRITFYPRAKTKLLDIAQQENGYDCSIHTLYNTIQLLTHSNMNIEEIDFQEVTPKVISELRLLVFQQIMQQNSWVTTLPKFKKIIKNQKKKEERKNRITQN